MNRMRNTPMKRRWQLGLLLNAMGLDGDGAEIGVHKGEFALQILRRWRGRRLWLIDPWSRQEDYRDGCNASDHVMQRRYESAQDRLRAHTSRTAFVRRRSDEAALGFSPASLDFVYIDANHAYVHAQRDLSLWYEKVRPGGLIAGHDYFNALTNHAFEPVTFGTFDAALLTSFGVKAAVDQFAMQHHLTINTTAERWPTWYAVKPT